MITETASRHFCAGAVVGASVMVVGWGCGQLVTQGWDKAAANRACQNRGYSAGHYEKAAGLVCEQWIEAAKVPIAEQLIRVRQ